MNANHFIEPIVFLIVFGLLRLIFIIISRIKKLKEPKNIFWYLFVMSWVVAFLPIWKFPSHLI